MAPEVYQAYPGVYQFSHSTIEIAAEGGSLYAVLSGGHKLELVPETETRFYLRANKEIEFTFVREESGRVTRLLAYQEGQTHEGKKDPRTPK